MIQNLAKFIDNTIFLFLPKNHPWDYVMHFLVSFIGVILLFLLLSHFTVKLQLSFAIAASIMMILGLIKEINDFLLGKNDMVQDALADLIGIAYATCAIALSILFAKV